MSISSPETCCLHLTAVEDRIRPFSETTWAKVTYCILKWIPLGGAEAEIASNLQNIPVDNVLNIPYDSAIGFHQKCYNKFSDKTRIEAAEKRLVRRQKVLQQLQQPNIKTNVGDLILDAHTPGDLILDANTPGDLILDVHTPGDLILDAHTPGDLILDAHTPGDIILDAHTPGDLILDAHTPGDLILDAHTPGDLILDAHTPGDLILDAHTPGDLILDAHTPKRLLQSTNLGIGSPNSHTILPAICIICRTQKYIRENHSGKRNRERLSTCKTNDNLLLSAATSKQDENVLIQIRGKDMVAIEVKYHPSCYRRYTRKPTPTSGNGNKNHAESFKEFCSEVIEKRIMKQKEILGMNMLTELFVKKVFEKEGVDITGYKNSSFKLRIRKLYPDLCFIKNSRVNCCELVTCDTISDNECHLTNPCSSTAETEATK